MPPSDSAATGDRCGEMQPTLVTQITAAKQAAGQKKKWPSTAFPAGHVIGAHHHPQEGTVLAHPLPLDRRALSAHPANSPLVAQLPPFNNNIWVTDSSDGWVESEGASMNLVSAALRRPFTVMVIIFAIALGSFLAVGEPCASSSGSRIPQGCRRGWKSTSSRA